jgi:HprK-related kinase B
MKPLTASPQVPESRQALVAHIREALPAGASFFLRFGDCTLEVQANHDDIIDALRSYFQPFVVDSGPAEIMVSVHEAPEYVLPVEYTLREREPGKTKIKEEYYEMQDGRIVRKRLTGMVFVFGAGENVGVGPCCDNLNQVVNFINNRYIEWILCQGCLLGHAAGVILNGRGLAMAGFSGAGKSTLALHLMNEGATFISNDRLMIEKSKGGLVMHGVAKMPRINPGTALNNPHLQKIMSADEQARFAALPEEELWELEHKYDALIDDCYGPDRFVLRAAMNGLILLNWRRNGGPTEVAQVDLAERRDLLPAFMKNVGLFFLPTDGCRMPTPVEETYIDFLSRCRVLEISGGINFAAATQACRQLVDSDPGGN